MSERVNVISENTILEVQMGFCKGKSCIDFIVTMIKIIKKQRERNLSTCVGFIDYENAFDRVRRYKLWDVIVYTGFSHYLIPIQNLYSNTKLII